ncbi:hypothetical protein, partial [Pinirhizobacter soli]|uniref:hypothetical protein n=1 Tax=Pinirhizobacter soli TaxID=2786953 RepID=UPI002029CE32
IQARRPHNSPAHTVKDRFAEPGFTGFPQDVSSEVSRPFYIAFRVRQHPGFTILWGPGGPSFDVGRLRAANNTKREVFGKRLLRRNFTLRANPLMHNEIYFQ